MWRQAIPQVEFPPAPTNVPRQISRTCRSILHHKKKPMWLCASGPHLPTEPCRARFGQLYDWYDDLNSQETGAETKDSKILPGPGFECPSLFLAWLHETEIITWSEVHRHKIDRGGSSRGTITHSHYGKIRSCCSLL